jgi:hypothetical protein
MDFGQFSEKRSSHNYSCLRLRPGAVLCITMTTAGIKIVTVAYVLFFSAQFTGTAGRIVLRDTKCLYLCAILVSEWKGT